MMLRSTITFGKVRDASTEYLLIIILKTTAMLHNIQIFVNIFGLVATFPMNSGKRVHSMKHYSNKSCR